MMRKWCLIAMVMASVLGAKGQEVTDTVAWLEPSADPVYPMPYMGVGPYHWGGYTDWPLHEGLNVSLGASVFAQFGKHARHGAGFQQNVSMMYAMPQSKRWSLTVGGYINNVYWSHDNFRDAGVKAVLGYRFNEHWEGYLYGQKSLVDRKMPLPLYDVGNVGDRIGAAIRYNFSPSFSIQVNVEKRDYPLEGPIRILYEHVHGGANRR